MSVGPPGTSLPGYLRLPDGLRFSGAVDIDETGRLSFLPKQALSPIPPVGLPVELVIAGLPDDEERQLAVSGSVERADPRLVIVEADDSLPDALVEHLDPDSILWLPPAEEAQRLLSKMRRQGIERLDSAMRRFLLDLGDHLFDLSTSSRYGMSGQHHHYDALNQLKRLSEPVLAKFHQLMDSALQSLKKDSEGQSFADLEEASARGLELVALEEMDQKLAVDKLVNRLIETYRVELESLTIRCAFLNEIEPRKARTPFHPAHLVQALVDSLEVVTSSSEVMLDILKFYDDRFSSELDQLYPAMNKIFVDANVEPGLEEEIRQHGSLLNPPEQRIVKSVSRDRPRRTAAEDTPEVIVVPADGQTHEEALRKVREGVAANAPSQEPRSGSDKPADKHDAMYDAVISALDTQRRESEAATGAVADSADDASEELNRDQVISTLRQLQGTVPAVQSLAAMQPLSSLMRGARGDTARMESYSANRLNFIDNVFQTLHRNFDVSEDMAPNLSKLRLPLARLSLREPRFFTQPEHPAHQLLDKLSTLASADHTVSRSLQNKVSRIVDRVVDDYDEDSDVFSDAQQELDGLLGQQNKMRERNVERVIGTLEGQDKLFRAQRRVESLFKQVLSGTDSPRPLQQLIDGSWRSALVQLAIREGQESVAWREEEALLKQLLADLQLADSGTLDPREQREMRLRLRALGKRLHDSNPGAVAHERPIAELSALLAGERHLQSIPYTPPTTIPTPPPAQRVDQLPRLKRWLQRVAKLEPGATLSYRGKDGRRKKMQLIWVSEDGNRFAFVNERGQKIAELTAVQLARQLSRGAKPPNRIERMSVLDQSMYDTLEQAQRTLSFDRNRDQLTQLINGDSLVNQLSRSVRHAQARGAEHAFILLDIDKFSLVNEVFDETSGNEVLAEFAKLLGQLNDRRSLTARLDEDEFGILLTYRSIDEARDIADKIRADIASSVLQVGNEPVSFTVSMGIAPIIQESEDAQSVIDHARTALQVAKRQGRDQVQLYTPDQQELLDYQRDRDASRSRLDEAMSTDRLVMRAQPIVQSAVDGSETVTHHYEMLLALRDDDGELQSPVDFIASAERFGYVTLVDRWVLREVFSWISALMDKQKIVPELSINLSGSSITDNDFLDYILEQISEFGVGTSKLCFEITETGAIDNLPRAADFVRTLRNLGCKFSLDDFGTGLASHKYLKELPVDYVKIDGAFITNVHKSSTDYAMAKSINDLAHFLGQKTVAECVEDLEIVPSLREIGIDYLQGWGIGMPRSLDEVTRELSNLET